MTRMKNSSVMDEVVFFFLDRHHREIGLDAQTRSTRGAYCNRLGDRPPRTKFNTKILQTCVASRRRLWLRTRTNKKFGRREKDNKKKKTTHGGLLRSSRRSRIYVDRICRRRRHPPCPDRLAQCGPFRGGVVATAFGSRPFVSIAEGIS